MKQGIIRLAVLLAWAFVVLFLGGLATGYGVSPALVGGLELAAFALGVIVVVRTAAWGRSMDRSRERAGV